MRIARKGWMHWAAIAIGGIVVLGVCVAVLLGATLPGRSGPEPTVQLPPPLGVDLVKDQAHTLLVPESVRESLGILKAVGRGVIEARPPTGSIPLVFNGSTALDPTRLMRIRARFAPAEVVQIAQVPDEYASRKEGRTVMREIRSGDLVSKGDLLAVFYSVDVGSKKNDLVDALVQLRLDQEILDGAEEAYKKGSLSLVSYLTAQRNVEADRNAISRALNTLKTWNVPEEDIKAVQVEAEEIKKRQGKRDPIKQEQWARVKLIAPGDGTIVERNVSLHETVVDNTINLFQIAKVDRLLVVGYAPEDFLPTLLKLPTDNRRWTIRPVGAPLTEGITGPIEDISYIIDVNQHNAVIKGYIANPDSQLRGGQAVTARIDLPPPPDVVEIPIGAFVDDGKQCVVFVQTDAKNNHYTLRRVLVTHRFDKTAYVRSRLTEADLRLSDEDRTLGLLAPQPLAVGEKVLTAGVLELKKELEDRENAAEEKKP